MRTTTDPHAFDEFTPPPLGTLRDVANRHGCTIDQAQRIMGVEHLVQLVPLGQLLPGDAFRFNFLTWRKGHRTLNHWKYGWMIECHMKGGGTAYIAETKPVEPINETD